jgi:hypothetical protein
LHDPFRVQAFEDVTHPAPGNIEVGHDIYFHQALAGHKPPLENISLQEFYRAVNITTHF